MHAAVAQRRRWITSAAAISHATKKKLLFFYIKYDVGRPQMLFVLFNNIYLIGAPYCTPPLNCYIVIREKLTAK